MKFEIKSVGPFKGAKMDILPITVISGMTNTGKTVLCKAFYHTFRLLNSDRHEQLVRAASTIIRNHTRNITQCILEEKILQYLNSKESHEYNPNDIGALRISNQRLINNLSEMIRSFQDYQCSFFRYEFEEDMEVKNKNQRDDAIPKIYLAGDNQRVEIKYRGEDCGLRRINNKTNNSIYYVDSHYLLEDETKISPNDTTLPKRIEGILTYVKNDLTYIDKDGKFTCKRGEQKGTSSGLKIFIKLESLLRGGELKEGDMIILDNPEIFTQPHYQLYLGELIVLIQKLLHINVLIVTNSLYLLDALDKFTLRHSDDDYYKNIAFYLVERSGLHSTVRNVSTELEIVYGHLYAPMQSLMNMEYGVYNDYDCMIQES